MHNTKMLLKRGITLACLTMCLAGCGEYTETAEVEIPRKIYQKSEYVTTTVNRGDMKPELVLKLKAQVADQVKYSVNLLDAEVEEVYVTTGEKVEKGQLLVSFKSEKTKKEIEDYSAELEEKQLMLEHYTRMSLYDLQPRDYYVKEKKEYPLYQEQEDNINAERDADNKRRKAVDYDLTIEQLQSDVNLASMYLEEANARLEECQIRAEEDGVISFISQGLMSGYVEPGAMVITEITGESSYVAYTIDTYDFQIGDTYEAEDESSSYKMTVSEVSEESSGTRTIVFVPDSTLLDPPDNDSLVMTIQKQQLKDVVYVDAKAVNTVNDRSMVYLVSPEGFLDVREVELGEQVDDVVVIKSGLDGNEKVAIVK